MIPSFKKFFHTPINESLFTGKAQGNTSKLWIMRSGAVFSTGGMWHYQWALKEAKMLKNKFGIDMGGLTDTGNEQEVRIHLIKQGMFRVNHSPRGNAVTIEGVKKYFSKRVKDRILDLVMEHSGYFNSLTINLFDETATKVVENRGVNMFAQSSRKKVDSVANELY